MQIRDRFVSIFLKIKTYKKNTKIKALTEYSYYEYLSN